MMMVLLILLFVASVSINAERGKTVCCWTFPLHHLHHHRPLQSKQQQQQQQCGISSSLLPLFTRNNNNNKRYLLGTKQHQTNPTKKRTTILSISNKNIDLYTEEEETTTTTKTKTNKKISNSWYPVRPADALKTTSSYNTIVKAACIRHVLLETESAADLALNIYMRGNTTSTAATASNDNSKSVTKLQKTMTNSYSSATSDSSASYLSSAVDPFGDLARDLSACSYSREDGGRIGWVDNPSNSNHQHDHHHQQTEEMNNNLLSKSIINQIFQQRPRGGDILKLQSIETQMWHLIRIDDLMIDYIPDTTTTTTLDNNNEDIPRIGSMIGINKVIRHRPKLKGSGILPTAPALFGQKTLLQNANKDQETAHRTWTYHIATTGCQMNVADSERMAGVLESIPSSSSIPSNNSSDKLFRPTDDPQTADVVILNTCSIRDHAERKVYDALGPHAARKRRGEPVALIVSGCVAQQEGERLLRRVPEVDVVMGPQYVGKLADLLEGVSFGHQIVATDPTMITEDLSRPVRGHDVRAWVNAIYGCNEHCTYCVVPAVRGVEQSRSMESILEECCHLASAGYKEITLLGQNIDSYGRDMRPRRSFADLLHYLNEHLPPNTIHRIRYVTSHPRYFSDRVIDAVASLDKVCECFHMPFQSGNNQVLSRMRRGYTRESYLKIIQKIRTRAPDASICGDVIVGFPGESDFAFSQTLDLMERVQFDNLNTFAYSPRPNTEAATWSGKGEGEEGLQQIPEHIKAERLQMVQRLATIHATKRSERYVGRTVEVLVEDGNPRNINQVMGRTRQGRQVFFDGSLEEMKGRLVDVYIEEARPWSLTGRLHRVKP